MKLANWVLLAFFLAAVGCGGGGGNNDGGDGDNGGGDGDNGGGGGGSTEGLPGLWVDQNAAGNAVIVIEDDNQITGFANLETDGLFHSVFGTANGEHEIFQHRNGDDANVGSDFTLVGDLQPDITYTFTLSADQQTLTYDNGTLVRADTDTIPDLALADIAGTYVSSTSFVGDVTSSLSLTLTIAADGALSGQTSFDPDTSDNGTTFEIPLTGTATDVGQYMTIDITWNGQPRVGVLYRNPSSQRLVLNTAGPNADDTELTQTLSAIFTLQ